MHAYPAQGGGARGAWLSGPPPHPALAVIKDDNLKKNDIPVHTDTLLHSNATVTDTFFSPQNGGLII